MFAQPEFIDATRRFVCIRIETYESKASEQRIRSLLGGRFVNTAFCIFDPHGERRLSAAGRSPSVLADRGAKENQQSIIREMARIAGKFDAGRPSDPALLQDFDTFRQALNVAASDQRLLIAVTSDKTTCLERLRVVMSDDEVVGKFHLDLVDRSVDEDSLKSVVGVGKSNGVCIIRAGQFGLTGTIMRQIRAGADAATIKQALLACNAQFAATEKRKNYREHVAAGMRQGVYFKNEIPYGEDRNADGVIDNQQRRRRR